MSILVLHISDLHIKGPADPCCERAQMVSDACASAAEDVTHCILIVTGDIAHSGLEVEYLAAESFFTKLSKSLASTLGNGRSAPIPVHVVPLPGNHDCDFTQALGTRQLVLDGVRKDPSKASDSSVQAHCVAPQSAFRSFRDKLTADGISPPATAYGPLLSCYALSCCQWTVQIRAFNSAWCSERPEGAATLIFPEDLVPQTQVPEKNLVVGALHHPFGWLQPDNSRALREALEQSCDLILTGHEHSATRRYSSDGNGHRLTHVEAPVFRSDDDPADSGFNLFLIDLDKHVHRPYQFTLRGDRYEFLGSSAEPVAAVPPWQEFPLNKIRSSEVFRFSKEHLTYLQDIGVTLNHREIGPLHLQDIFVFPDLQEITFRPDIPGRLVPGQQARDFLAGAEAILISGEGYSGKTALSKALCTLLQERGDVPVLIDACKRLSRPERIRDAIDDAFKNQYQTPDITAFHQLDPHRRVVIVDDVHRLTANGKERRSLINYLKGTGARFFLIADELAIDLEDLTNPEGLSLPQYRIQPFGYLHRNDLVEKWLNLSSEQDAVLLARKNYEISRRIDQVIGRGFVPAYPAYVLAVLQASDASVPFDASASTHGYYYEVFIKAALVRGEPLGKQLDVLFGCLAFLAHRMFTASTPTITAREFQGLCKEYGEKYAVSLNANAISTELTRKRILRATNDSITFTYKYIYYYFVACYLRDHLSEPAVKRTVTELAHNMGMKQNADVLLFLAHLSKDPFIVSELATAAEGHFSDRPRMRFEQDIAFLSHLGESAEKVAYEDQDSQEARRKSLATRDEFARGEEDIEKADGLELVGQLAAAFRCLQIVGQVLKNYPGHLDGETKMRLADAAFGLGTRAWSQVFGVLSENEEGILDEIVQFLKTIDPDARPHLVSEKARTAVLGLAKMCSFGVIRRIAEAIGAPELTPVCEELAGREQTDAARLVLAAVRLEHSTATPEADVMKTHSAVKRNPAAAWILQQLVLQHFTLFPVDRATKQRLCAALEIKYLPRMEGRKERKLLGPQGKEQ